MIEQQPLQLDTNRNPLPPLGSFTDLSQSVAVESRDEVEDFWTVFLLNMDSFPRVWSNKRHERRYSSRDRWVGQLVDNFHSNVFPDINSSMQNDNNRDAGMSVAVVGGYDDGSATKWCLQG